MVNTTILVDIKTREKLRNVGKKFQTYDQIINELLESKKGLQGNRIGSLGQADQEAV